MKKITIDELIPLLKKGWVAMDKDGQWWWFGKKPNGKNKYGRWRFPKSSLSFPHRLYSEKLCLFDIERVEDWKDSLRKVE